MSAFSRKWFALVAALLLSALSGCESIGPAPVGSREGCGSVPEGYYCIVSGDSLSEVALRNRVDLETLASWNDLEPPYPIYAGKLLRVAPPGGASGGSRKATAVAVESGSKVSKSKEQKPTGSSRGAKGGTAAASSGLDWRWPLSGRVAQGFSRGDPTRQGIRIAGRAGDKVAATEAGTVVYSGSGLKGYGNLIIVKHNNQYLSAYGFNRRLLLAEGARVTRGQSLAEVGQTPGGEYILHFEIRRDGTAVNPLDYLPASR
jgi:lipoprotein NlpD